MFSNKNLSVNTTFSSKNLKTLKMFYKSTLINSFLLEKSFVLFYFYEFLSKEDIALIKIFLNNEQLKGMQIKKNILKNVDYFKTFDKNFLNNLIKNNVLLITPLQNQKIFDYKIIQKFQSNKKFHFLGGFFNKKFYRPSEIKKLNTINSKQISKTLVKTLQFNQNLLKNTLLLKKVLST